MNVGAFGAAVYRDRSFVASLRDGRSPRLRTVDLAFAVMGEPPAGPAFLREVRSMRPPLGQDELHQFWWDTLKDDRPHRADLLMLQAMMEMHRAMSPPPMLEFLFFLTRKLGPVLLVAGFLIVLTIWALFGWL